MVFSTDGLSEAMDPRGGLLGEERVRALLEAARGEGVEELRDRLVDLVDHHRAGRERADDLTLIVLGRDLAARPVESYSPVVEAPLRTTR